MCIVFYVIVYEFIYYNPNFLIAPSNVVGCHQEIILESMSYWTTQHGSCWPNSPVPYRMFRWADGKFNEKDKGKDLAIKL